MAFIHNNPDNECEGFERVIEWRPRGLHDEPYPLEQLAGYLAAQGINAKDSAAVKSRVEFFDRAESRNERWAREKRGVKFIKPPSGAMVSLYEDNIELRKIERDYSFRFERDGRKFCFIPPTPDDRLPVGEQVCGFMRPDENVIHLFSGPDGKNRRYLLTWPREGRLGLHADAATKAAFFNRKGAFFRADLAEANAATEEQWQQAREEAEHNNALVASHGLMRDEAPAPNVTTRSVQAVTAARTEREQSIHKARKVDLVKETLKREPREKADAAAKWA